MRKLGFQSRARNAWAQHRVDLEDDIDLEVDEPPEGLLLFTENPAHLPEPACPLDKPRCPFHDAKCHSEHQNGS
jgi:hypothetical protein